MGFVNTVHNTKQYILDLRASKPRIQNLSPKNEWFLVPRTYIKSYPQNLTKIYPPKIQLAVKIGGAFDAQNKACFSYPKCVSKVDPKIKLKIVPLNVFALNAILFPRSRNFPFYDTKFGPASTGQTRLPPRRTAHLVSLHAAVPRTLNTTTKPSSACPKSGGEQGSRSGARQLTISPSAHIHLATIRRTCTRVHVACTLGEFPTPRSISERIQSLRHGE